MIGPTSVIAELRKSTSEQQTRALRVVASRDDLTGLLNRKAFLEMAAEQLADRHKA